MAAAAGKPGTRRTKPGEPTLSKGRESVRQMAASVSGAAVRKAERTKPAAKADARELEQEAELEALMRQIDERIAAQRKALDALLQRLRAPRRAA